MEAIKIAENIYWVGVIDWNLRNLHGYSTHEGSSYNAFLILDEKVVLIDTVKKEYACQLIDKISDIIDPKKIDLLISNHTEMDHSGSLPEIMHRIGEDKPIICSAMGEKALKRHFKPNWNYRAVKDGEELSIGKRTLQFFETRMLHWPDSMFSYVKEDEILFSSDAFGQHYAGPERFDDDITPDIWYQAKKYYANILLPYSELILKLIEKVKSAGLSFKMICPDHGIMWRANPLSIIEVYSIWAKQEPTRYALVIYDTMWNSTKRMAEEIVEALGHHGVYAKSMHIKGYDRSEIVAEVLNAGAVIIGSPTINNGLYPTIADFLCYFKGLKPANKVVAAFGSYGWSGEAVKLIGEIFNSMGLNTVDSIRSQYLPDENCIKSCHELAKKVAEQLPF